MANFAVLSVLYNVTATGVELTITTDVPCHLWMRWSHTPWDVHLVSQIVRGTSFHVIPYYCIVAYKDNEQEEAGDTTTHTFIKEPWEHCETRYFHFWGEIGGQPSPSESALFEYHRVYEEPPGPIEMEKFWDDRDDWGAISHQFISAQTFTPQLDYSCTKITQHLSRVGNPGNALLTLQSTLPDGSPSGVILASSEVSQEDVLVDPAHGPVEFTLDAPHDVLTDVLYAIVFTDLTTSGTHYYRVWGNVQFDPYPRGNRWIKTWPGGDWSKYDHGDWHFITWGTAL